MRLRSLGLPAAQANELITVFQRWTKESGREWTCSRLKSLKQELIARRSGGSYRAPWVSRNRRDTLPSGIMHYIFKSALSGSDRKFNEMLNVLMVYSTLTVSKATKKQKEKFFGSMMSQDETGLDSTIHATNPLPYRVGRSFSRDEDRWHTNMVSAPHPRSFLEFCTSDMKSAPSVLGPSTRNDDAYGQFIFFVNSKPSVEAFDRFPEVFRQVVPLDYYADATGPINSPFTDVWHPRAARKVCMETIGKIGLIQEPGCKLRAVASPNAIWQAALEPLKTMILKDLRLNYPTDCTHDQELGARVIQNWLKQGKTCHSVDLSDATNMMPLHLQIQLLRDRYLNGDDDPKRYVSQLISAFEFASRAPWYLQDEVTRNYSKVSFTRGQPLGLQPSFAVFALSHNEILLGICKKVGVNPTETFRILGDDIVISDSEVHRRYRLTLKNLGCPVSESKCLSSNTMAEFAGYVITQSNLWHAYKWRDPDWSNFEAVLRMYGPKARQLVYGLKRKIIDLIAPLPEEIGGLGWNPKGLPLSTRLDNDIARAVMEYSKGESLESYISLTSLLTDFNNQVVEGGGFNVHLTARFKLERKFPAWASSPGVVETGWDNSDVTASLAEAGAEHSKVLPQDSILATSPPDGISQRWLPGYGVVLKHGNVSQDPRILSKRSTLLQTIHTVLSQRGQVEENLRKFELQVNGIRRSHPAPRLMERIDQSAGPLRQQRIPVQLKPSKKARGLHH